MRIGILGTLSKPITTSSVGGTEAFCVLLAMGLKRLGHEVALFATPESSLPDIPLIPVGEHTRSHIREVCLGRGKELNQAERDAIDLSLTARLIVTLQHHQGDFDVFHDNTSSFLTGSISDMIDRPIVTTMHMPAVGPNLYLQIPPLVTDPKNIYVSVSKYQQMHTSIASHLIYHGMETNEFPVGTGDGKYMVWIGRISPNAPKGVKEAIEVSKTTGKPLKVAGDISDQAYYTDVIQPSLGPPVEEVGVVTAQKKYTLLGNARVGLFPIQWEEPFGFVFLETMACGTPIIAFARGSVPEIVDDGVTGFIVNPSDRDKRGDWIVKATGLRGIEEAVERIYAMSSVSYETMRRACRKRVETQFQTETMIRGYEQLYREIIGGKTSES